MEFMNQVEILDEVICISFCTNVPGKNMNPSLLPQAMVRQPVKEKEKL